MSASASAVPAAPWRPASLGAVDVDAIGSGPAVAADGFMVFLSRPAG
jgi:hypothetical protein